MKRISATIFIICIYITMAVAQTEKFEIKNIDMVPIPGKNYKILRTEVTQEMYETVMGFNPSYFKTGSKYYKMLYGKDFSVTKGEHEEKLPVERVSAFDAIYFCNKLSLMSNLSPVYYVNRTADITKWGYKPNMDFEEKYMEGNILIDSQATGYRLPYDFEWRYAAECREEFLYSGSEVLEEVAWYSANSNGRTHQVALKKANKFGLYDMSGNVWEWCMAYSAFFMVDFRGGGYYDGHSECFVNSHCSDKFTLQSEDLGFRIVCLK